MFGFYRYLLAVLVVASHLWPSPAGWCGFYAVFSFYVLSGFLMATVLQETYGYGIRGTSRFLANRLLRLFPPYCAVLAATVLIVLASPEVARGLCGAVRLPAHFRGWLHNIFLLGLNRDVAMLVPPAWSLDVELRAYIAMALLLTRRKRVTLLWLALSALYTLFMLSEGYTFADRYFRPAAASLPFSLGATLYFYRSSLPSLHPLLPFGAAVLFAAHTLLAGRVWQDPLGGGLYFSLALSALAVALLAPLERGFLPKGLRRLDRAAGDLSYPVFLSHWAVAILLVRAGLFRGLGPGLFLAGLAGATLVSLVFLLPIERAVAPLRTRLRSSPRAVPGLGASRVGPDAAVPVHLPPAPAP